MTESTITAKGQTTVPADIRALVHAKPGTRLVWSVMPDGTIIVRAKTKSILDMAGMLIVQLEVPMPAVEAAIDRAFAAHVPVLLNPAPATPLGMRTFVMSWTELGSAG